MKHIRDFCVLCGLTFLAATGGATAAQVQEHRFHTSELVRVGWGRRILLRFDLSSIKNPERISKATLHLTGREPAGPVEVRPITTGWGGTSEAFKTVEKQGVWNERRLGLPGYKAIVEVFHLGETDWDWAVIGARRWNTPGGDLGATAATATKSDAGWTADITRLARSWAGAPSRNFGAALKLAAETVKSRLPRVGAYLAVEGQGLQVGDGIRVDALPGWLPKTYRAAHPRLSYPSERELRALRSDPVRLAALCRRADSFDPKRARSRLVGDLVLAQKLAPTAARARVISRAADAGFPNHGSFERLYALAQLYDWGYEFLSPDDRRRLASRIERECTGQEGGSADTCISPYNDVGTSRYGCGLLWGALAIYPDIPAARKHLFRAWAYYVDTTIPVWHHVMGDHGGYWHEMHGYYLGACLGRTVHRVFSAWSDATGQDLYARHPWIENMLYSAMYSTRPDMYRIRLGDIKCSAHGGGEPPILLECFPELVRRFNNPYGRWWLQRVGRARLPRGAQLRSWHSLPTVRHSDGVGVVNMRSGWSEDATYVSFKCGPSFWSHSHLDSGTFAIYKRGPLAIDAGNYNAGTSSEHHKGYMIQSIAHNVITVTDPKAKSKGHIPNDGGQRPAVSTYGPPVPYSRQEWERRKDEFDTGRITAFQTTKHFTYVRADVTAAYNNSRSGKGGRLDRGKRVRKWIRSLVYLPPDHVVIFDEVETFSKDFKIRWLLHTINEPKIDGSLITVERADTVFRFTAWDKGLKHAISAKKDHPFFQKHTDCRWYGSYQPQLYQYDGVMFVRTLLPKVTDVVKIGGPGKECWADGKNRVRNRRGKAMTFRPYTGEGEAGNWRIEVSPKGPTYSATFLHVIQVGLKSKAPKPTMAKLVAANVGIAAVVDLGKRRAQVIFYYGKCNLSISDGRRSIVSVDCATKVLPNPKIEK